jgi:isochorismate pyruvate lyase
MREECMKSAADCESLEEIRAAIDTLDKELLSTLSKRQQYVLKASSFKKDEEHVRAPDRVASMITKRQEWARQVGLSPELSENLFRMLVAHFIGTELREFTTS